MSDEPVVEPEVKEPVSPQAEETAPAPDPEPVADQPETQDEPHALDPEGKRFKQVWARAKAAEAEKEALKEQAQREREERIRLEERLKAQEEAKAQAKPKLTWANYEAAIEAGQIDRAQAMTLWTEQLKREAKEEAVREIKTELETTSKASTVLSEIERYKQLVPEVAKPGTVERQKIEREYAYMVNVLNFPPTHATELAATRAALGDIETVERSVAARRTTTKEPFMETHSSTNKPQPKTNDPIKNLDERKRAHYERMIANGRYSGWDEVRAELTWTPPSTRVVRG